MERGEGETVSRRDMLRGLAAPLYKATLSQGETYMGRLFRLIKFQ